ncbi:MAG TPA: type I-C CRISPR-associated protein Cas8c/Csd1 [Anaerohalosphaeraceae bacterium]|nr:type I-C CRISPR-associated protein Cas8c/Csd1 [Anaerohalosphaeraceae bacterium]HOL89933.1 type I-C CRISPR-associated protein Cas8c/Csd1 [Anaerohalosphaeraceae bacterium]
MILQELCRYYERLAENPAIEISPPGFSREKIHAEIVLDSDGNLLQFNDLRVPKGKRLVPREMIVPQSVKRTSSPAPNFLWDNTSYVLGADNKGKPDKAAQCFELFCEFHRELLKTEKEPSILAFLAFLSNWDPQRAPSLNHWDELAGGNVVFRLDGERQYLHEKTAVKKIWLEHKSRNQEGVQGYCLVTGQQQPIARLHPAVKGVRDTQSSGAAIVTFNLDAFCSYGKEQNFNAPIGEMSAFSYTTALNYLLANDSRQRLQIGDATTVFWTERPSPVEGLFGMMLDPKEADVSDNAELRKVLEAVREGRPVNKTDSDIRFFILGLSPNAARIAVRFWHVCTVGEAEERIGQHFRDLRIRKDFDSEPDFPGIWRLLRETVNQKASDSSPQPLLAASLLRSILEGTAYPESLLTAVINRIRAEQSLKDKTGKPINNVNYVRAAILKAILVRKYRLSKQGMEVSMALDKENKNPAYLLGRLFAVLEKVQQDASPGINTTIKDRFWGAASATPKVVFPQLLRLAQHHLEKAEYGRMRDKQIEEILADLSDFPAHLSLDEQGLFAIGYYHQRQDFFKGKESRETNQ